MVRSPAKHSAASPKTVAPKPSKEKTCLAGIRELRAIFRRPALHFPARPAPLLRVAFPWIFRNVGGSVQLTASLSLAPTTVVSPRHIPPKNFSIGLQTIFLRRAYTFRRCLDTTRSRRCRPVRHYCASHPGVARVPRSSATARPQRTDPARLLQAPNFWIALEPRSIDVIAGSANLTR
jgi:hypothetical protein